VIVRPRLDAATIRRVEHLKIRRTSPKDATAVAEIVLAALHATYAAAGFVELRP